MKKTSKKMKSGIIVVLIAIALVFGFFGIFKANAALTQSQSDAIISLLESFGADQVTIDNVRISLTGGIPSTTVTKGECEFDRDLTIGRSGKDVTCLQDYLTETGHFTFGNSTGYFGSITQSAVAEWQADNDVSPAVGYFGTISRAKYDSKTTVVVPTTEATTEVIEEEAPVVNIAKITVDNPVLNQVLKNAKGVTVLKTEFKGNDTINSLTVEKVGWLNKSHYKRIYLYKDGVRLDNSKTFNSNDVAVFTNLNFTAPFKLDVVVDFDGEYTGINTGVRLSGNYNGLPLSSDNLVLVDAEAGLFAISSTSTVDSVIVNQSNAKIAEFKLTASSTEAITVKEIELYNEGHNVLSNVKISDGSNDFSGIVSGSRLIFNIDTYIKEGRSKTFKVYADVDGRSNDNIKLVVRNSYDIRAIGEDYGFGAELRADDMISNFEETIISDFNLADAGAHTVTIENDLESQAFAWGDSHKKVLGFTLKSEDESFEITSLKFALSETETVNTIKKVEVYQGSNKVGEESVDGDTEITIDTSFIVNDEKDLSVYVDLNDLDDTASSTISVDLIKVEAIGVNSDEEITIEPTNIEGKNQYVYSTLIEVEKTNVASAFYPTSQFKAFSLKFTSSNAKFATSSDIIKINYTLIGTTTTAVPLKVKLGSVVIDDSITLQTESGVFVVKNDTEDDIELGTKTLDFYVNTLPAYFDYDASVNGVVFSVEDENNTLFWTGQDKDGDYFSSSYSNVKETIESLPIEDIVILKTK